MNIPCTSGPARATRLVSRPILLAAATVIGGLFALSTLPGCNTTEGIGKDVKSAGAGIEDAAQDAKD